MDSPELFYISKVECFAEPRGDGVAETIGFGTLQSQYLRRLITSEKQVSKKSKADASFIVVR